MHAILYVEDEISFMLMQVSVCILLLATPLVMACYTKGGFSHVWPHCCAISHDIIEAGIERLASLMIFYVSVLCAMAYKL